MAPWLVTDLARHVQSKGAELAPRPNRHPGHVVARAKSKRRKRNQYRSVHRDLLTDGHGFPFAGLEFLVEGSLLDAELGQPLGVLEPAIKTLV